jgi:medium-chain acyl-[acyl-carrier-protein] hydrolase
MTNNWLTISTTNLNPEVRLFCLPYAGGGASIFRTWREHLPGSVAVCPVNLPGRESRIRERPRTDLEGLVGEIARAMLPHLDRPFALFGHSMGAVLAFEVARRLRGEYMKSPSHLFVSGHRAPQIRGQRQSYDLPEPEFIQVLHDLNGTVREVLKHPELLELMLPLLRADFELCETYSFTPGPPLDCPLTALGGLFDPDVTQEHLELWRAQTTGPFAARMLPGDHFFIRTEQALLLRTVANGLVQARAALAPAMSL